MASPVVQSLAYACRCGAKGQAEIRRSWVLDEPAEYMPIVTNQFHRFHCASCKQLIMLDPEMLVTFHAKNWAVYVVPDDAATAGVAKMMKESMPDKRGRIVANRTELMEKVRLFEAGIDDVAFALAKLQRRAMLGDREGKLKLYFDKVVGDQIELAVIETGVGFKGYVKIPREVVDRNAMTFDTKQYEKYVFVDDQLASKLMVARRQAETAAAAPAATAAAKPAPFSALHSRGRDAHGVSFVTDGGVILREDAVAALGGELTYAPELRELTAAQIGGILGRAPVAKTSLDAAYPSTIYPNAFRTRDGVALSTRYVQLLRKLPGPIECRSTGPHAPVLLFDGRGALGAVMPIKALPERDEGLPEPDGHAIRAKINEVYATGGGTVVCLRGVLKFAPSALHELVAADLVVGALVDGYADAAGEQFAAMWPAGMPRPASAQIPAAPAPSAVAAAEWPANFVSAFATKYWVGGVTKIQSIAHVDCKPTPHSPPFTMHVVQRVLAAAVPEGWRFVVSDGLAARPLVAQDARSLQRFEIATYTRKHDPALLDTLASLGEEIHRMTSVPGARPVALGHTIEIGAPGIRGWTIVLLSRMGQPIDGPFGPTDVVRITPITVEERAELRAREDYFDGWGFTTALENRDFLEVCDRWYARIKA